MTKKATDKKKKTLNLKVKTLEKKTAPDPSTQRNGATPVIGYS